MNSTAHNESDASIDNLWFAFAGSLVIQVAALVLQIFSRVKKSTCGSGRSECLMGEEEREIKRAELRRGPGTSVRGADKNATLIAFAELGQRLDELARRLPVTQKSSRRSRRSSVGAE